MPGERIAVIGLGTMGAPMARNLLQAGFELTVHNRTRAKEEPLEALGARRAASPAEAAARAEIVITMVSDTLDVESVLFGPRGVVAGARGGSLVVDMSTISPAATRVFGERLRRASLSLVDAPVSGGSEGAAAATLTIFCGGEERDVARARPVLEALGKTITHLGPLGSGQLAKATNQVIIAGTFLAVAEGMVFALKAGLDPDRLLPALGGGMARSAVLEMRARNMIEDHHPLGFRLALHLKDLRIALEEASRLGVELPVTELVYEIEADLVAEHGDEDMSVIAKHVRRRAGL